MHADWKRLCLKATEDEVGKLTEKAAVHSCNEHNPAELFQAKNSEIYCFLTLLGFVIQSLSEAWNSSSWLQHDLEGNLTC